MNRIEKWDAHELHPKANYRTKADAFRHIEECYAYIDQLVHELGMLEGQLVRAKEEKVQMINAHSIDLKNAVAAAQKNRIPITIEGAARVIVGVEE